MVNSPMFGETWRKMATQRLPHQLRLTVAVLEFLFFAATDLPRPGSQTSTPGPHGIADGSDHMEE